jgi:hypothetical protein
MQIGEPAAAPGQRLLLYCASAGPPNARTVRALCDLIEDWEPLLAAADHHGLEPLLARAVETAGPGAAPPDVLNRLRASLRDSAMRALYFAAQLSRLTEALREGGAPVIALKGPALAEALYSDPALRPFSDLDLFVRKEDVAAAIAILGDRGYSLAPHLARLPVASLTKLTCEASLASPAELQVDLHWDVAPGDYPFRIDPEILWRGSCATSLAGRNVLCGLEPEVLLLYLCVHGAKHRWSRLIWLADVARLARKAPDWTLALRVAAEAGCERPLLLGLLLGRELLAAPVPESLIERAKADETVAALARLTGRLALASPPQEPGAVALTNFNARLANRLPDRLRCYAGLLRAPTEAELALLPLPESLFLVYYPIRLVRVAAKFSHSLVVSCRAWGIRRAR